MNFQILPYTKNDGIRNISDSNIKKLFDRTKKDGLDKIVFFDGFIQTADQFLFMAKSTGSLFYVLYDDEKVIGYAWLNRFESHTARMHYCTFADYWGHAIDIGKFVLKELIYLKDANGDFIWDLFKGIVPAWNERAVNFSLKCGGKKLGVLPGVIWNQEKQKSEDGIVIYYTRGE